MSDKKMKCAHCGHDKWDKYSDLKFNCKKCGSLIVFDPARGKIDVYPEIGDGPTTQKVYE